MLARWRGLADAPKQRRLAAFSATVVACLALGEMLWIAFAYVPSNAQYYQLGMDYVFFKGIGTAWLADGSFYLPHQLTGPYVATTMVDVLYPPLALLLFVPAAVLPAVAWWLLPALILLGATTTWRPSVWALLTIAIVCLYPSVSMAWLLGSSSIWMMAILAAALVWGYPAALLAIKPFLMPLGLLFVRRRAAWIGGVAVLLISLPMAPLWLNYFTAMKNASIDPLWAARDVPVLLIPIIGWAGRTKPRATKAVD